MSTSLMPLIRLAIFLLALAALAKSSDVSRLPAADVLRGYVNLLSNEIPGSFCQSQVENARLDAVDCLKNCSLASGQPHQIGIFSHVSLLLKRNPCVMRCSDRLLLVLRLRGDAYDQLVASTQCNATSDQKLCRATSFLAAKTADLSVFLTSRQRYENSVCKFSCGQMFPNDAAGLENCMDSCEQKLLMGADAFNKLSECTAKKCNEKTGEGLRACKKDCLAEC